MWDPFSHTNDVPTPTCLLRLKRDIKTMFDEPPPNIFAIADDNDITVIHALITGNPCTPYEGGFFYFLLRCPPNYPMQPPYVKFMTTGGGSVRFNPNLYKNGKVCLSILGTWSGPGWSPANTLSSCLMSIQSLLGEKPYHNEPGYDKTERSSGDSQNYSDIIQHETLRVAVCGMINNDYGLRIPAPLVKKMEKTFLEYYDRYESVAKKNLLLNNQRMVDPFGDKRGYFQYENLLTRLADCKNKILAKMSALTEKETAEKSPDSPTSSTSSWLWDLEESDSGSDAAVEDIADEDVDDNDNDSPDSKTEGQ